jgi:hypothetical protein
MKSVTLPQIKDLTDPRQGFPAGLTKGCPGGERIEPRKANETIH